MINNLVFDKVTGNFTATIIDGKNEYGLTIADFSANDKADAEILANNIGALLPMNLDKIKAYAAGVLTALKNEDWLEDNELPLDETDFAGRIKLESILAFADGSLQVFFDDGDIFWGHNIVVDIDSSFTFNRAVVGG